MVGVSASVNLPLHNEVQKFSSGTGSPGWSRRKGRKMVVCVCVYHQKVIFWFKWRNKSKPKDEPFGSGEGTKLWGNQVTKVQLEVAVKPACVIVCWNHLMFVDVRE